MRQCPVQPRDTHVIEPHNLVAVYLCGERSLLGHGDVGRAARRDDNLAEPRRLRHLAVDADVLARTVVERRVHLLNLRRRFGRKTRNQNRFHAVFEHHA